MSWTGSENQRRPQGIVEPPKHEPKHIPRFEIKEGTYVEVRNVGDLPGRTQRHKLKRDLGFERYDSYRFKHYTFRFQNWLITVHRCKVIHREDLYKREGETT